MEGDAAVHGAGDPLGGVRRADARRQDENVVADAHLTVRAAVSHKSTGALSRNGFPLGRGSDILDRNALEIV